MTYNALKVRFAILAAVMVTSTAFAAAVTSPMTPLPPLPPVPPGQVAA